MKVLIKSNFSFYLLDQNKLKFNVKIRIMKEEVKYDKETIMTKEYIEKDKNKT